MISHSVQILTQLTDLLKTLDRQQYGVALDLLSQNSIGKHTRHILEFYQCVFDGLETGVINYDKRSRNSLLENDKECAQESIVKIIEKIKQIKCDRVIFLQLSFSDAGEIIEMQTSYFRELAYNLEHTVHHLAILKIAISAHFSEVKLPLHFGVAHSTQAHQLQQK